MKEPTEYEKFKFWMTLSAVMIMIVIPLIWAT